MILWLALTGWIIVLSFILQATGIGSLEMEWQRVILNFGLVALFTFILYWNRRGRSQALERQGKIRLLPRDGA